MMCYIGTSLGKCLRSLLLGEVHVDQVLLIVAGTRSLTEDDYVSIVEEYWQNHDLFGSSRNLSDWEWAEVHDIAILLWRQGKIHQPRNFGSGGSSKLHEQSKIWIEMFPPQILAEPAAKDLWDQLRMVAKLYE